MNYKQLQALIYVARHRTFKKAAEALYFESPTEEYVTPESIQYRIKQLEAEINVSLYRKRQGSSTVLLTREGLIFLKEAIEVFQRMREWRGMFFDGKGGNVTFAATQTVLIHRLVDPIKLYRQKNPTVSLTALNAPAEVVETMVGEGTIDFGISTRRPDVPELEYVLWKKSRMVMIAPPGHPLAKRREISMKDLENEPLILLEPDVRGDRDLVDEALGRAGIKKPNIVMETSNSEVISAYVEAGVGVGIVAETATLRQRRRLVAVEIKDLVKKSEVGLLVREGQYLPPRVRNFIALLDPIFEEWLKTKEALGMESTEDLIPESLATDLAKQVGLPKGKKRKESC